MGAALLVHIAGGTVALITGFTALALAKGSPAHRRVGRIFLWAMLTMGLTGAAIAAVLGSRGSVVGGLLAAYLATSGVVAVRPPTPRLRRIGMAALFLAVPLGLVLVAHGVGILLDGDLVRDGVFVPVILLFGAVALLSAAGDYRRLRAAPARAGRPLTAHLWRMCFALFIASGSFFLGQADEIPEALRIWPALFTLALLPLVVMPYWLWRVRRGRVVRAVASATGRSSPTSTSPGRTAVPR